MHEYLLMKLQLIQKYTVTIKNSPSDPHLYSQSVDTFLEGKWVTSKFNIYLVSQNFPLPEM